MPKPTKNPGPISFTATIQQDEASGAAGFVVFPYDLKETYGIGNLVPVVATFDGVEYRGSIAKMGPGPLLLVRKDVREKIGKSGGDEVQVTVMVDDSPRSVDAPDDFQDALANHDAAAGAFEGMSYSNQKEYVDWIESAKKHETRERRIAKAVELLADGKPLK